MIIGVTGYLAAGKDTLANHLVSKGCVHISLSDLLREELGKRGKPISRETLIAFGNELRSLFGPAVLGEMALRRIDSGKNYVVTSIRNPAEVAVLAQRNDFVLVEVQAPVKVRFERIKNRQRGEGDPQTLQELQAREKQEQSDNPNNQQLHKVVALASVKVVNDGTIEKFHTKIDKFLGDWKPKLDRRPSWDEYFIGVSREVSKRATCDRGRSGCVIVKDKRILTTGYVGSPIGIEHCDEAGHQMHSVVNPDGSISQHCIRTTHAEQNAITQAARYGIPIDGATLYSKMEPCHVCAKIIINAGVKRVVCERRYHAAQLTRELFKKSGVQLDVMNDKIEAYTNQAIH